MGLGIGVRAALPRGKRGSAVLKAIAEAAAGAVRDEVMGAWLQVGEGPEGVAVHLFPAAEPLEFTAADGFVTAMAKTSTTGAGYHAEVVELVDRIGRACGLEWDWDGNEDVGAGDETGYACVRDFGALQRAMEGNLQQLGRFFAEGKADAYEGTVFLNWGLGAPRPVGPWEVMSPSGSWSIDWMRRAAAGEGLAAAAEEFYPWCERGRSASGWAKLAAMLMWSEIRWHVPAGEHEDRTMRLALLAAERGDAGVLRRLGVDAEDIRELGRLLEQGADEAAAPRPSGFGVLRGTVTWTLEGSWTVDAPGYFYIDVEDEGAVNLSHGERAIRVSVLELDVRKTKGSTPREIAAKIVTSMDPSPAFLDCSKEHVTALASVKPPGAEGFGMLAAAAVVGHEIAVVNVSFSDPRDRDWAVRTFRTVRRPEGSPE